MLAIFYMVNFNNFNLCPIRGFDMSRVDCCRLIRIVTGYAFSIQYLHKIEAKDSLECEYGFVIQDLNHILWACSRFNTQKDVFLNFLAGKIFPPFSIHYLIIVLDA